MNTRKCVDYDWERERVYGIEINEREVSASSTHV
jgi:hypothetical protein